MKNRTTLVIAHRLATVVHVDRIAVFDHGQLVDIGSHQQLLKSSKLYQRLAQLQFHYQHGLDLNHDKRSENRQDEE